MHRVRSFRRRLSPALACCGVAESTPYLSSLTSISHRPRPQVEARTHAGPPGPGSTSETVNLRRAQGSVVPRLARFATIFAPTLCRILQGRFSLKQL
eukprot:764708-Hanusia_phi.AAC.7